MEQARRTRRQVLFVRFDERSRRGNHFVVHLKRNFLGGSRPLRKRNERMWANEIHVQVPKHSWQFPRVIGSWLRGVFYPYDESNTSNLSSPRDASRVPAGPDSFVQRICVRVRVHSSSENRAFRDRDFIVTLSSTTLNVTYRNAISCTHDNIHPVRSSLIAPWETLKIDEKTFGGIKRYSSIARRQRNQNKKQF